MGEAYASFNINISHAKTLHRKLKKNDRFKIAGKLFLVFFVLISLHGNFFKTL